MTQSSCSSRGLHHILCSFGHFPVYSLHESRDVIHEDPQLQREMDFCDLTQSFLQYNTLKQTTPLRPWQYGRDGLERLCHTPFKLHSPLAHAQTTGRLTLSNGSVRSRTKATAPCSPSFAFPSNLSISINISHTKGYFSCHFAGALKASHPRIDVGISAIGLSLVTFFGIKKKHRRACLLRPLSTLFHLLYVRTRRFLLSFLQVQRNLGVEAVTPHSCFALYSLDTFSKLALEVLPPIFSVPHSPKASPPHSAPPHHTAEGLEIFV